MEIDNTIFQDLESLGKESFSKTAMEKSLIFVWEILRYPKIDSTYCHIKHCICYVYSFYYLNYKAYSTNES